MTKDIIDESIFDEADKQFNNRLKQLGVQPKTVIDDSLIYDLMAKRREVWKKRRQGKKKED